MLGRPRDVAAPGEDRRLRQRAARLHARGRGSGCGAGAIGPVAHADDARRAGLRRGRVPLREGPPARRARQVRRQRPSFHRHLQRRFMICLEACLLWSCVPRFGNDCESFERLWFSCLMNSGAVKISYRFKDLWQINQDNTSLNRSFLTLDCSSHVASARRHDNFRRLYLPTYHSFTRWTCVNQVRGT